MLPTPDARASNLPFSPHLSFQSHRSREMESTLAFLDGKHNLVPHHLQSAVVRQLEIVDTSHHAGKVVVGPMWRFSRLADDGKHR